MCKRRQVAVVAYGSLGCGHLVKHPVVVDVARRAGKSPAQVGDLLAQQRLTECSHCYWSSAVVVLFVVLGSAQPCVLDLQVPEYTGATYQLLSHSWG